MKFISRGNKEERHRLIILTDMENEADDSQTMVKLLMYSNEIDIEGLIAVTSRWLKHTVYPESIVDRIHAFGVVRDNLCIHASGWPTVEHLLSVTEGGNRGYGMAAVGDGKNSRGSDLIIKTIDKDDDRPIYFAINAGSNTLAQAIWDVSKTRSKEEVNKFISKIRVYDDSGQDDAGAWMCHNFPNLFYVRSRAQVFGLFGPTLNAGPKSWAPQSQYEWAEQHVRVRHGVLGALYPQRMFPDGRFLFMDGGGTTTWLGLANKGLYDPSHINWGGWGGRMSLKKEQVYAGQYQVDELEHKFEPFLMYPEAKDTSCDIDSEEDGWDSFSGVQGDINYSKETFYPLWRWRNAYTNDFKARMDWCVADYARANHPPVAAFYDDEQRTIVYLEANINEEITLDASNSWDPDRRTKHQKEVLFFNWSIYKEAGTYDEDVSIIDKTKSIAKIKIPNDAANKQIHVILEVTDSDKETPLTSYRRIVINIK